MAGEVNDCLIEKKLGKETMTHKQINIDNISFPKFLATNIFSTESDDSHRNRVSY